jgi:hypothetical protein
MGRTLKAAWALFACCALLPLLAPHRSLAQGDHRLVWRSLHSRHFDVHYHEPLGRAARILLAQVETANDNIERSLGLALSQRVALVLEDDDDAANGFATPLPYNAIRLRAVAPEDMSPLADYDDWSFTLLIHEHTHIVHLEQASGLPRLLQRVFGRFYTPQQKLPGWFIEGLAVVEESAHTSGGRARSAQFDMFLRMDALEDRFLGLDLITFDGEPWPHGNVRYAYGQAFLQFISERHGTQALGRFIREYGRRAVPYGVNRAMRRASGESFVELYEAFRDSVVERAREVEAQVRRQGVVEGRRITQHAELTRTPRFLGNDEIAYFVADARHVPELRTLRLDGGAPKRVSRVVGPAQVSRVPGRDDTLLFSAIDFYRGRYAFQELFEAPRTGGRPRRLTHGLRGREPDVAPDGRSIVFVTHGAGTSHLELAQIDDIEGTRKVVVRSRPFEQVFTPRFSPDGTRVAYGAWSRGGYRDLWVLELATGRRTRLTYDRALDRGPVFSPDGRKLYFSSDRTGIDNLYVYDFARGLISQLTNVVGGAFQPDVSPDGKTLVYVGYGARGFDLYLLPLSDAPAAPAQPSYARPPMAARSEPATALSEPYRPYPTLYPRAWELSTDELSDNRRLVVSTSGADVVGFHSYSLRIAQSLEANARSVDVAYAYQRPRFPVYLRGGVQRGERGGLIVSGRELGWDARSYQIVMGASFGFPRALRSLNLRTEYGIGLVNALEPFKLGVDPNYPPPIIPEPGYDARFSVSLTHATAQQQPFDISRSWGHVISLWATASEPYLGGVQRASAVGGRLEQYFRFDFRESVLALAYTGAWNTPVSLGGYSSQPTPILDSLVSGRGAPADYARLRGFPMRYGDQLHVAQLEYRALLVRINRGIDTLPIFARRVHSALFVDAGDAFTGRFDVRNVGLGVGAELRLDWAAQYGNNYMLRAGVARGLTQGGVWQWYTTLAYPF